MSTEQHYMTVKEVETKWAAAKTFCGGMGCCALGLAGWGTGAYLVARAPLKVDALFGLLALSAGTACVLVAGSMMKQSVAGFRRTLLSLEQK